MEFVFGTQGAVVRRLPVVFSRNKPVKLLTVLGAATMRVRTSASTHQQNNGEGI